MSSPKRIGFSLALIGAISVSLMVVRSFSKPVTVLADNPKIKVLRRKNELKVKPTKAEVASLQNSQQSERELEDKIPKHLPIKVKIRMEKEKAFKDLDNDAWLRDLEIEVTNTGDKPIFYFLALLHLPEVRINESHQVFSLRYGRVALSDFAEKPDADDVPIKPNESFTLRVPSELALAWLKHQATQHSSKVTKARLVFQVLNFGDGTGFQGTTGAAWPESTRKRASARCLPPAGITRSHHARLERESPKQTNSQGFGGELAHFAPARFSWASDSLIDTVESNRPPEECCSSNCSWRRRYETATACYGLYCESIQRSEQVGCNDSRGSCSTIKYYYQPCYVAESNFWHNCAWDELTPCANATPSPTPTPLPTPEPGLSDGGLYTQQCVDHYWVWFVSYDGGVTWWPTGEVQFAGCFLTY